MGHGFRTDVTLIKLDRQHADAMLRWMSDPMVSTNLGLRNPPSQERTLDFITRSLADDSLRAFAILVENCHVGNVVLDQIDRYLGTGRLSIYVGESRGRGIGSAAIRLATQIGFEELGLYKIWLVVHARNQAAIRAYERVGFRIEGRLRGEFLLGNERLDAIRMGLLSLEELH